MVGNGSVVTLRYEGDEDAEQFLVGSVEERRADLPVISTDSPLGQALMGHRPATGRVRRSYGPAPCRDRRGRRLSSATPSRRRRWRCCRARRSRLHLRHCVGRADRIGWNDRLVVPDPLRRAGDVLPIGRPRAGGALRVGPAHPAGPGIQSYASNTLVCETMLHGRDCTVSVTDAMPWDGGVPAGRVVRLITAHRGPAEVDIELIPGRAFRRGQRGVGVVGGRQLRRHRAAHRRAHGSECGDGGRAVKSAGGPCARRPRPSPARDRRTSGGHGRPAGGERTPTRPAVGGPGGGRARPHRDRMEASPGPGGT